MSWECVACNHGYPHHIVNRLLHDSPKGADNPFGAGLGQAGLARFERDVLAQTGISHVIVGLGINDILFHSRSLLQMKRSVLRTSSPAIVSSSRVAIETAFVSLGRQTRHLRTLPSKGWLPVFFTSEREAIRQKVNDWIRSSGEFDGVVDLDAVLRDPSHPTQLPPAYDSGDHLHPNNAGCIAEGNAIPLALFEGH